MNVPELYLFMWAEDLTLSDLAEKLGMTELCLADKLFGPDDFTLGEIRRISELLNLTEAEADEIFFGGRGGGHCPPLREEGT